MKRKLTKEEHKKISELIAFWKEEKEYDEYLKGCAERDLNFGLDIKYKKSRREIESQLKEINNKLRQTDFTIATCEKQIKEGVEVKEEVNKDVS